MLKRNTSKNSMTGGLLKQNSKTGLKQNVKERMVFVYRSVKYARQSYHARKLHCPGMQRGENT